MRSPLTRKLSLWTPRYIFDRIGVMLYERRHPDAPWLTKQSVEFLSQWLKPTDIGFEWGSGRSSLWFAQRIRHLTSVEHDPLWYEIVRNRIVSCDLSNIDLRFHNLQGDAESAYVRVIDEFSDDSLDIVVIDGRLRDLCTLAAIRKVRHGGILVIDNVNRYLPNSSHAPESLKGKKGGGWAEIWERLNSWRCFWSSSGVTDTAIFFCNT